MGHSGKHVSVPTFWGFVAALKIQICFIFTKYNHVGQWKHWTT